MVLSTKKCLYHGSLISIMIDAVSLIIQNPWWKEKELINEDEKVKTAMSSKPLKEYSYTYKG